MSQEKTDLLPGYDQDGQKIDLARATICIEACANIKTEDLEAGCVKDLVEASRFALKDLETLLKYDIPKKNLLSKPVYFLKSALSKFEGVL